MVKRAKAAAAKRKPRQPATTRSKPIALVLIDDNRVIREGLTALIHAQPGFKVLASAADADEALVRVREARPDVVLVDFGLGDHDSLSLTATVHKQVPEAGVIVMGLLSAQADVADYVRAGASGFIMKNASLDEVFATIREVAGGREVLPLALTTSLFEQVARRAAKLPAPVIIESVRLTDREQQVVKLLGEGLSNEEIAVRLNVTAHTVKSQVNNVLEKLTLRSRLEVAAFTHMASKAPKN